MVKKRSVIRAASGLSLSPYLSAAVTDPYFFFIPVTTPTVLDGSYMKVSTIAFLFDTTDARIDKIDIYDGTRLIQSFANPDWYGDHGTQDASNTLNISPESEVKNGVVVLVQASFMLPSAPGTEALPGTLQIRSVGVRFVSGEAVIGRPGMTIACYFVPDVILHPLGTVAKTIMSLVLRTTRLHNSVASATVCESTHDYFRDSQVSLQC